MTNNQLTENSVNQLLNSVRLARDNAERADNRVDHSFYYALTIALEELQERRKAEQDRDPLAYTDERNIGYINQGRDTAHLWGEQNSEPADVALYRHAQPARVETEDLYKLANHIASSKSGLPDEWLDWAEELETDIRRAAMLQAVNSPAHSGLRPEQSNGSPAQDGSSPEQNTIDHGYRPECECSGCKTTARICAELAGNSPVIPDGYVIVPKEPTERMVIAGFESEPDEGFSELQVWEAYEDMSGCEQAAYRARLCWAAMLAAAPQEPKS